MPYGSSISASDLGVCPGGSMICTGLWCPLCVLMPNPLVSIGLRRTIFFAMRSWTGSAAGETVQVEVLDAGMQRSMAGPQGLRQWLAGCFSTIQTGLLSSLITWSGPDPTDNVALSP